MQGSPLISLTRKSALTILFCAFKEYPTNIIKEYLKIFGLEAFFDWILPGSQAIKMNAMECYGQGEAF
jgi:hypothetical protein